MTAGVSDIIMSPCVLRFARELVTMAVIIATRLFTVTLGLICV